jgi:hypothetical protein
MIHRGKWWQIDQRWGRMGRRGREAGQICEEGGICKGGGETSRREKK